MKNKPDLEIMKGSEEKWVSDKLLLSIPVYKLFCTFWSVQRWNGTISVNELYVSSCVKKNVMYYTTGKRNDKARKYLLNQPCFL